jgi:hypothetical protein
MPIILTDQEDCGLNFKWTDPEREKQSEKYAVVLNLEK